MNRQGRDSSFSLSSNTVCSSSAGLMTSGRCQAGVTLIEVLVTLLLVSIGLVGSLAMQARAMQDNQSAFYRSQAVNMATDLADRVRLNPQAARADNYTVNTNSQPQNFNLDGRETPSQRLAKNDLRSWLTWVQASLPLARGQVRRNGDRFTIDVLWDENKNANDGIGGGHGAEARFRLEMEL
ncbi:MAG: type IV pilus modification protein PilV [Amphritea sp.]|nr:type IV pilus modification protein PilV [Amphritea sp.]